MRRTESLGDIVVIHPLDPEDGSAIIPIRTAGRTQKGVRWRIDARKQFDALMEGVSPPDDVTFESATVGVSSIFHLTAHDFRRGGHYNT